MKRVLIFIISIIILSTTLTSYAKITNNAVDYLKIHSDIKVALVAKDIKKAKSIIKELIPVLESDIAYTKNVLSEEEDEYFIEKLSATLKRQKEIKDELESLLKNKSLSKNLSDDSINIVRELRRLSLKPKAR